LAVLTALTYRQRTGKGQYVDLGQYQAISAVMGTAVLDYVVNGRAAKPIGVGNYHQDAAPYGVYRCAGTDRWCVITVFTEEEWRAFCQVLGDPGWTTEPGFATLSQRIEHRAALDGRVTEWTTRHTPEAVMYLLQKAGVPAAMVQDAADLARDPHLHARGFWEYDQDPDLGVAVFEGIPEKLSETPGHVWRPAPQVGQHNAYVYGTLLGMSPDEIEHYSAEGVF
jgi:benzylsuccinate CoA-transferase BbsF subunit